MYLKSGKKSLIILNNLKSSNFLSFTKYVFIFFIFFPYLTPIDTPWSLQPYSFFFSLIIILIYKNNKINKHIIYLLIVSISSILIAFFTMSRIDNSIRSIANYVSFPFIIWASILIKPTSIDIKKFIKIASFIYFIIGFLQYTILPDFLSFLVPHQGTSDELFLSGRGVSSLTPEPSYFGFMMLLFFFFGIFYNDKILKLISLISILFLAKSITVIFCLLITLYIIYSFKNTRRLFVSLISSFIIFIIFIIIIQTYVGDTRALVLMQAFLSDGFSSTIENDASATGRLYHITYPISQSFSNYLIPFGFNGLPNGDTRILSGIGGAVYELGFISIILIYNIFTMIFKKNVFKYHIIMAVGVGLILFILNANQIGMPVFCFIISYIIFSKQELSNEKLILNNI